MKDRERPLSAAAHTRPRTTRAHAPPQVIELTPNVAGDKYAEKRTVLDPGQVAKNDGQQDPALCDPPSH